MTTVLPTPITLTNLMPFLPWNWNVVPPHKQLWPTVVMCLGQVRLQPLLRPTVPMDKEQMGKSPLLVPQQQQLNRYLVRWNLTGLVVTHADGPITYEFQIAVSPTPFGAPTAVRALAESSDSAYVEWVQIEGPEVTPSTTPATYEDPTSYIIMATSETMGAATPRMATITDVPAIAARGTAQRMGGRISGLTSGADYTITVEARRGMGPTENIGRASAAAVAGQMEDATSPGTFNPVNTVTPLRGYGVVSPMVDNTFVLSTGESVEIDPQTYLLNMAIHGRDDFGFDCWCNRRS